MDKTVGRPGGPGGEPARGPAGPPPSPTLPIKQDFAKLTLGMFATSFSSYPLSFGHAGQAEAPEGKADVLDVKGGGNFTARFFIDSKTHLPLMLSWTTPPNLVPVVAGQKPPANLAPGSVTFETPMPPPNSATPEQKQQFEADALAARKKAMASARPTENRIYYADYRDVDGLKLPFASAGPSARRLEEPFSIAPINARSIPKTRFANELFRAALSPRSHALAPRLLRPAASFDWFSDALRPEVDTRMPSRLSTNECRHFRTPTVTVSDQPSNTYDDTALRLRPTAWRQL